MPSDPWFEELDPLLELWLWESWCQDLQDENDFAKAYAILGGSFTNPDAARAMIKADRSKNITLSDEEFAEETMMLAAERKKSRAPKKNKKRRRRHRKRVID